MNKLSKIQQGHLQNFFDSQKMIILEEDYKDLIVANDSDELVFIIYKFKHLEKDYNDSIFDNSYVKAKRNEMEKKAYQYLLTHNPPSGKVRFDEILVRSIDDTKVFIRHHRDCFSTIS